MTETATATPPSEAPTTVMDPARPDLAPTTHIPVVEAADDIVTPIAAGSPDSPDAPAVSDADLARSLELRLIDQSQGVVAEAGDYADAYVAERTSGHGVRGFIRRIWHGNIARDYILQRQRQQGRDQIVREGNIYTLRDGSQAEHDAAEAAIITSFAEGHLHGSESEVDLREIEGGTALESELRTLITFFAQDLIGADELEEEKTRVVSRFGASLHAADRDKGLLYADNVLQVAMAARAAFRHNVAIERISSAMTLRHGEALMGARTQARREVTDRIVDRLHGSRVGSLLNETTLGVIAGVAVTAAKLTTRKSTTAAAAVLTMGAGAGLVAAAREHARVGQERAQHARERATGQQMPEGDAVRREAMEQTRYETIAATEAIDRLAAAREAVDAAEPVSLSDAVQALSEIETRVIQSDLEAIDLISFSRATSVAQERLALDRELLETRTAVSRALGLADEAVLHAAGLSRDLDALLVDRTESVIEAIQSDRTAKDAAFSRLRRNRTLKMGAVGFLTGEAIGLSLQEARAALSDELQGVFESTGDSSERRTLLRGMFGGDDSSQGSSAEQASGESSKPDVDTANLGDYTAMEIPKGYQLVDGEDGRRDLLDKEGKVLLAGIATNQDGHLTEDSVQKLKEAGFAFDERVEQFTTRETVKDHVERSARGYLQKHPDEFTKVHRELWYDNNTPAVFDQNELRLWWGGGNGTGLDDKGNYVFNVQQMMPDGSYHNELSADAQALVREGKMAIALSMTKDTQSHVVMIPIDKNGNAVIDADSWMAKSLFDTREGKAHFTGAYAEAVQLMDKKDGVQSMRMLATVVGENKDPRIADPVSRLVEKQHNRTITTLYPPETEIPTEIPPVMPIYSRRGLENLKAAAEPELIYVGGPGYLVDGYRAGEGLLPRAGLAPFAPELEADPDAKIDADKSARRYVRAMRPGHRRAVETLADNLEKQPAAADPKAIVMIPAAAHQEGKNIYNTLTQYLHQKGVAADDFEVVVFANYPKGKKPDETIQEVERFQKEHPELKVRLIQKELEPSEATIGWIRKAVTDSVIVDLLDRGVDLEKVMLVSNDADSEWINPNYLQRIIKKAEAAPETDGFLGFIDWSYEAYKSKPEMLVATRFMQMLEIYLRSAKHEIGSSGANFAFRPGIYTAIGGYRSDTPLGEDVILGRMIKSVRAGAGRRPIAFLGRSSEVNTSARRALEKLFKDGGAPAAQWDEEFGVDDSLRTRDFDLAEFDYDDPAAVATMLQAAERMLNQTLEIYSSSLSADSSRPAYRQGRLTGFDAETVRRINSIGFHLGVTFTWQPDGSIKIADYKVLLNGLREWQAKH